MISFMPVRVLRIGVFSRPLLAEKAACFLRAASPRQGGFGLVRCAGAAGSGASSSHMPCGAERKEIMSQTDAILLVEALATVVAAIAQLIGVLRGPP